MHLSEYYALLLAIVLGAHILVMSTNLIMVFISIELISISSYVLAGFSFSRKGCRRKSEVFPFRIRGISSDALWIHTSLWIYRNT